MPGVTKHIFDHEMRDIQSEWNKQIKAISKVLPRNYGKEDIIAKIKEYYPHEWKSVEYKKQYYDIKDKYIKKFRHKTRYDMLPPEIMIEKNTAFKQLLKVEVKKAYADGFSEEVCQVENVALWRRRERKIKRINDKIVKAVSKTQTVTPDFLDTLIGLYERKNTTQMDRMYIIYELMKYYNPKVIQFFFKCNDTELNRQLREIAFKHLQSFNYMPRLRRQKYMQVHAKNGKRKEYLKKIYPNETYRIPFNPNELEYRLLLGKEQKVKTYKYFISHSSADAKTVQKLIDYENKQNHLVFCDWINDSDYLKRNLVCEATLKVIEWRLQQSEAMIFIRSENSLASVWCQYELNFFNELKRPIYVIDKESIEAGIFAYEKYDEKEYYNSDYKKQMLIEKSKYRGEGGANK